MAKLNQIIAVVSGKKSRAEKFITDVHHGWKADRLTGISRTYQPLDDEGDKFPDEKRDVQLKVTDSLKKIAKEMADFYDVVATQETGNTKAKANIVLDDGTIILSDVPVGVLLFLEKQTTDLRSLIQKIPTLSSDKSWNWDENRNCYVTIPEMTIKTQKVPEVIVKYDATPEHPAQTELITLDKTIGKWATVHFSGAIPVKERDEMLERVEKLQDAIKKAREEANSIVVEDKKIGEEILQFVFGKSK